MITNAYTTAVCDECGKRQRLDLPFPVALDGLADALHREAAVQGWHDADTCLECHVAIDRNQHECDAGDQQREIENLNL